jgi:ABC-2 type transport system ATP-binding protein
MAITVILSNAQAKPIYQQIAEQLRAAIMSGEAPPGTELPSMRKLAAELRVSVITTKRAYEELEREGFLETSPGKGSYVAQPDRELLREARLREVEGHLERAVGAARAAGADRKTVEGLGKRYAKFELSGVSFRLERGSVMGLIGPNGAGKTTTIRLLMGLCAPSAGRASVLGGDPARDRRLLDRVGFVYEDTAFYGSLSARANARFLARVYSAWDEAGFRSLLAELGVDERKKVDELSRGQRTKLCLAVALSHGAELLVLDEPTSGLDPASRSEVLDLLYRFIADGRGAVLFSTHITADLEKIADSVTFLREGRLVFSEATEDALTRYALVKGPAAALEGLKASLVGVREASIGFEGLCEDRGALAEKQGLLVERPSLEDIMVYSTREDYRARVRA